MAFQTVFKRYELKYIITKAQQKKILEKTASFISPDKFGKSVIRNLYFDNSSYELIRRSIEKPVYKEKLRVRSYTQACKDTTVFVELKKKYDGVVYKRRVDMTEDEAFLWLQGNSGPPKKTQITDEIDYFMSHYGNLSPKVFICCDRQSYFGNNDSNFRVTFDSNIKARLTELSLTRDAYGEDILDSDKILMEIKCVGGMPLNFAEILSEEKIYKTPFSKYGTAYTKLILQK